MQSLLSGGNPFGGGSPFGEGVDAEEILKAFFGGRDSSFGFGTGSRGFGSDFQEIQQVGISKKFSTPPSSSILYKLRDLKAGSSETNVYLSGTHVNSKIVVFVTSITPAKSLHL